MNNDGPSKCVYLEGEDVAANVNKEAVRDEGKSKRKRYANTSCPIGNHTKVWKRMYQAGSLQLSRPDSCLVKIYAGKGEGAGARTESGGPTDAAVAHVGGDFDAAEN
eukprot:4370749-Heterocapsa_arctica.AAC.1